MSFRTLFKLLAFLGVFTALAFTCMLGYHVTRAPLGGIFERLIPKAVDAAEKQHDEGGGKMPQDTASLPATDPGEKAFQKAHELLALGKLDEAREKLDSIVKVFPSSASAPVARRIVGEINLDEILSTAHMEGKKTHIVKRGNSFIGIAAEYKTSIDCIMHLNSMMELKNIQPGEELVVMPLAFRLLIEPKRKLLSVWDGSRFIREYPIIHFDVPGKLVPGKTTIRAKLAEAGGHPVSPQSKDYRAADKIIQIVKPACQIRGAAESAEVAPRGIILRSEDMEEINLLTRVGNEVELR